MIMNTRTTYNLSEIQTCDLPLRKWNISMARDYDVKIPLKETSVKGKYISYIKLECIWWNLQ